MNIIKLNAWLLSLIVLGSACTALAQSSSVLTSWVQLGPEDSVFARAVTTDTSCPSIMLDSASQPMQVRAQPSSDYPVLVCEITIPSGTTTASIDGQDLPLPNPNPEIIVAYGDTGCKISKSTTQNCNKSKDWPAAQIAGLAAAMTPDLMIHLGDIIYRTEQCPDSSKCGGSPYGANWDTFNADFFTPQAELLKAAPWVLIRGNHEVCDEAGSGWFLFFDPGPFGSCQNFTDPYTIQVGGLQLQVFDSSYACDNSDDSDCDGSQSAIDTYSSQLSTLGGVTNNNAWFLSHRPVWGIKQSGNSNPKIEVINETLEAALSEASNDDFPTGVMMLLSGHIHLFESVTFDSTRPMQAVVGTGGTDLNSGITVAVPPGTVVDGGEVATFQTIDEFGFLVLELQGNEWQAELLDTSGESLTNFTVPADMDNDGVPNGQDADADNDGIPNEADGSGNVVTTRVSDNKDSDVVTFPQQMETVDTDGDGIPNILDLDSDGDGIPDHFEAGGNDDANLDGRVDSKADSDGDGLVDAFDPDQGGSMLSPPDTDGDGLPDFLDTDSDNDGVSDGNETVGCVDTNGDGKLDNSDDANRDGLADSVHPETGTPCALLDTDGDGLFDHLDSVDSTSQDGGCSVAPVGSSVSALIYLMIPFFILVRRLWRGIRYNE